MIKITTIISLVFLSLVSGIAVKARSGNKENLKISFEVGNLKIRTVDGSFEGLGGEVTFDTALPENASFDLCIDAASVNTGNERRDKHLRDEDYFHVEKYPTICFQSESVEEVEGGYLAKGQLTMLAVSREVEIPFNYENGELAGKLSINRFDYDLGKDVGTGKISEEVIINITYTLNKQE